MDEEILVSLRDIVSEHPWWTERAKLVLELLASLGILPPAKIIEAGCGWGVNFEVLEATGYQVTGLDLSRAILDRLDRPDRVLIEADLSQGLPARLPTYDCVLALDVIEHIDDDLHAARELGRLLKSGGRAVFSVPALPSLYSEFDEVQGHRRRYIEESFRTCLEGAGFVVESILWWGQWMVPLLKARRSTKRRRPGDGDADVYRRYLALPPWPGMWAMKVMFARDRRRTLRRENTIGTSLIAVVAKPSS